MQIGVLPLGTGNDLARVIGWGSVCDDDAHLPQLLERYEKASVKMLDRWLLFEVEEEFDAVLFPAGRSQSRYSRIGDIHHKWRREEGEGEGNIIVSQLRFVEFSDSISLVYSFLSFSVSVFPSPPPPPALCCYYFLDFCTFLSLFIYIFGVCVSPSCYSIRSSHFSEE